MEATSQHIVGSSALLLKAVSSKGQVEMPKNSPSTETDTALTTVRVLCLQTSVNEVLADELGLDANRLNK